MAALERRTAVPRQRSGELYQSRGRWFARVTVQLEGVAVRKRVSLECEIKAVARAKLDRLLASPEFDPAAAGRGESFEHAARRVSEASRIATRAERLRRLEMYAFSEIGGLVATKVKASHVRAVLDAAVARGLGKSAVRHLLDDMAAVFDSLWRDEAIKENPARRVLVPEGAKTDQRPRVVLSDAEFSQLINWASLPLYLKVMCLVARTLGGMRTSDLHAWIWERVDRVDWTWAEVYRPKTKTWSRLAVPDILVPVLFEWWRAAGCPTAGPVFPRRRGRLQGSAHGKRSHVRALRRAVWDAGVRRGQTPETCELQTDTESTRRLDFHGFRRGYCSGLARAGVNNQTAMALAGHSSPQTHARYVRLVETLEAPAEALPVIRPRAGLNERGGKS
jgi:integrase